MTQPASIRRFSAATAAALVCALGATVAARPAAAQETPAATSSLDLTLDTGSAPEAAPPPPAFAPPPSGNRTVLRSLSGGRAAPAASANRARTPLASRAASVTRSSFRQAPSSAPRVLAQLGIVQTADLSIRVERDDASRLLSVVPKGTYLAVVADGGPWWGVLMVNNTMGWVPKKSLQLIDYQTEIAVPSDPLQQERYAGRGAAGTVGGVMGDAAEGMDGRTVALLREAMSYLGVPYVWAGNTRNGLDCSGFVKNVFSSLGVRLPRHSGDQARVGQFVDGPDVRPGDRLYFDMGRKGRVNHCGIYLGNGYFIHASTNRRRVDVDSVFKPNYYKALVAIRRS